MCRNTNRMRPWMQNLRKINQVFFRFFEYHTKDTGCQFPILTARLCVLRIRYTNWIFFCFCINNHTISAIFKMSISYLFIRHFSTPTASFPKNPSRYMSIIVEEFSLPYYAETLNWLDGRTLHSTQTDKTFVISILPVLSIPFQS